MLRISARAAARSAARGGASSSAAFASVAGARQSHRQAPPAAAVLVRQQRARAASSAASASPAAAPASSPKASGAVGPVAVFNKRIEKGQLVEDEHQRKIVTGPLEKVYRELESYKRQVKELPKEPAPGGWLSRMFGAKPVPPADGPGLTIPDNVPKGLYLFGDVGCGKSMLMDLFYESLPQSMAKRRIHFHQFMIDAHKRMHAFKLLTHKPSGMVMSAATAATAVVAKKVAGEAAAAPLLGEEVDPIPTVARELAQEYEVLCFDEFQVTDIADAMILRRLLEHMLWHGVVFVMTSNRHPTDLYKNGIQRSSFLPCIALLQSQFAIVDLDSGVDYRKRPRALSKVYFSPLDDVNLREMDKLWDATTSDPHDPPIEGRQLDIWGRKLEVPLSTRRAARFDFMQLCGSPKSAADYIEVCRAFGTLFIDRIPRMGIHQRDLARRFITLVDACYESKTKVFMSSEVPILQIFSSDEPASIDQMRGLMDDLGLTMDDIGGSPIFTGDEELFAFARVISRLVEMQSQQYAAISRVGGDAEAPPEY